jgi:ribulose-bisphosphate carboxylase small chain
MMHVTLRGAFPFPAAPNDEQIRRLLAYAMVRRWAVAIEHAGDPNPSNVYWETWGAPVYEMRDPAGVLDEVRACRVAHPDRYIQLVAFDGARGAETVRLSFVVQRPPAEPVVEVRREQFGDRRVRYTLRTRPTSGKAAS